MTVIGTENGLLSGTEEFLQACEAHWPSDQPRPQLLTRAPGRLDCMGGMADFSGALALQMTTERCVHVAVGRREDERIRVESLGWKDGDGRPAQAEWPISLFYQADGQVATLGDFVRHFPDRQWVRHLGGVFLALLESGEVAHFGGGVNLILHSDIPVAAGLASSAAIQVAVVRALSALFHAELNAETIVRICRAAGEESGNGATGLVDHLTCLLGEPDALLQIRCQPDDVLGHLGLPDDLTFAAVDSGVRLPIYHERYEQNRISALMGRFMVERLLNRSGATDDPTGGYLANIATSEYVRRFRNELPVKIKGRDFLAAYSEFRELENRICPDVVYKVRSRTEHHIYENDRTHHFVERLSRVRRTGERDALIEAGELMYASHWSYGQRCGMGSIETDVLVNQIRARGAAKGLYGAKVTAGGCGGAVAVLMARNSTAKDALNEACACYAQKTGKKPLVLIGSSPGAMHVPPKILR